MSSNSWYCLVGAKLTVDVLDFVVVFGLTSSLPFVGLGEIGLSQIGTFRIGAKQMPSSYYLPFALEPPLLVPGSSRPMTRVGLSFE